MPASTRTALVYYSKSGIAGRAFVYHKELPLFQLKGESGTQFTLNKFFLAQFAFAMLRKFIFSGIQIGIQRESYTLEGYVQFVEP